MIKQNSRKEGKSERQKSSSRKPFKKAFTLSEVLITLAIIGIVAALVIPALSANYRKKEYSARLKRFSSTMQQAVQLSEIENGPVKNWDIRHTYVNSDGLYDHNLVAEHSYNFFMKYFSKYFKYNKIVKGYTYEENGITKGVETKVHLSDGTILKLKQGDCQDFKVDVNGDKKPNLLGYDIYYFLICKPGTSSYYKDKYALQSYCTIPERNDRKKVLEYCKTTNKRECCTRLLELDNFEYKDDYPLKI